MELIGALNRQPDNQNPLTTGKFKFILRKIPHVNFFCNEVTLPSVTLGSTIQPTPFHALAVPGINMEFSELKVTFEIDEDLRNYREILNWINGLGFPKNFQQYADLKNEMTQLKAQFGGLWSDAILHILTNKSNANVNVIFRDAFPVGLTEVVFKSTEIDAIHPTATASFKYAFFDIEDVT